LLNTWKEEVQPVILFVEGQVLFFNALSLFKMFILRPLLKLVVLGYFLCFHAVAFGRTTDDTIPRFPDLVYEFRFAQLHQASAIDLEFNAVVKKYIEIYTIQRRGDVSRLLGLKELYFPIFEEYLDKYGLPLELKYLPVIESGLNPLARSSSGAVGLWQFLYHSATMFNLHMTSFEDERSDIYKSTDAACKYLKYLYETYHDWHLVLASFNGGPGVVRNAMERSGGQMAYDTLSAFFPEQTQNYVPAFMAMVYVLNFASEHKIKPTPPEYRFQDLDTVMIKYNLQFSQLSEVTGIPIQTIRYLNPTYKLDVIPEATSSQILILPKDKLKIYLEHENNLFANSLNRSRIPNEHNNRQKVIYQVKQGDFLHKIAMQFGCSLEELKKWNTLSSDSVTIGQRLIIWEERPQRGADMLNR
jgi:membrane-bound lytic murein transglycosylase D